MTWIVHTAWRARQFDGTAPLDFDSILAGMTLKLAIVSDLALNKDTDSVYPGTLTPVGIGTAWTGPVTLTGITCALDVSKNLVFDANDPATIVKDAATGFANGQSLVLYDAASGYIIASHSEASAFGNTLGTLTLTFDVLGYMRIPA